MDIGKLNLEKGSSEGAWCQMLHPGSGAPLKSDLDEKVMMRVRVLGRDSRKIRAVQHSINDARLESAAAGRRYATTATIAEENHRLVMAAVVGWEGFEREGEVLEFSEGAADAFFRANEWASDQVLTFMNNRANFLLP